MATFRPAASVQPVWGVSSVLVADFVEHLIEAGAGLGKTTGDCALTDAKVRSDCLCGDFAGR